MKKLQVEILRDGKRTRIVEIPDPREGFCQEINELHPDGSLRAVPIEADGSTIAISQDPPPN